MDSGVAAPSLIAPLVPRARRQEASWVPGVWSLELKPPPSHLLSASGSVGSTSLLSEAQDHLPIVPYLQHGGQVPLSGLSPSYLPSPSVSPVGIPEHSQVAVHSSPNAIGTPQSAPGASRDSLRPTIDISVDFVPHEEQTEEASTFLTGAGASSKEPDTPMRSGKPAKAAVGTFLGLFSFSQIYQNFLFQRLVPPAERADETAWVASSHSWVDRKVCNWFGMCGLAHLDKSHWTTKTTTSNIKMGNLGDEIQVNLKDFWQDAQNPPDDWEAQQGREIPQYVLDHAPLIHLYSGEEYWPCNFAEHLIHTTPHLNYTPIQATDDHPNLANLGELNRWGRHVFLQSDDNVEDRPDWLGGESNIPNAPKDDTDGDDGEDDRKHGHFEKDKTGKKKEWWHVGIGDTTDKGGIRTLSSSLPVPTETPEGEDLIDNPDLNWQSELRHKRRSLTGKKVVGGRSNAPAVLVVVPKDHGVVDAFWFFFYSYNLGNAVFNIRFGNHVGDWEHTVVRFQHGEPKAVFFSEHSFGEAYTWEAIEKSGQRPIGFSATGTHAMYATPGEHPYVLPGGILHDVTDRGPLWDPAQNMYSYTYSYKDDTLVPSDLNPKAPTSWFYFAGHWGDKFYPLSDPRQYRFLGQYHYVNGPLGPRFKNLGRQEICQGNGECTLKKWIGDRSTRSKRWIDIGEGEEMTEEDAKRVWGPEYDSAS